MINLTVPSSPSLADGVIIKPEPEFTELLALAKELKKIRRISIRK